MSITETIKADSNLSTLAAAADWPAIVAAWPSIRLPDVLVTGRQTAVGLMEAGHDWLEITTAFDATAPGRDMKTLMQIGGINWVDPLTVGTLAVLKNEVITQGVIDTLVGLSQRFAVVPTESEVETAWTQSILEAKQQALQDSRDNLQSRFSAIKNQIGTVEQADAVVALRAIADELEA